MFYGAGERIMICSEGEKILKVGYFFFLFLICATRIGY